MSNYLQPTSTTGLPGSLNLTQFIQTVLVGLSGLQGNFVRPKWQIEPPKQPDLNVNWLAFGIDVAAPDANGYLSSNADTTVYYQRMETLEVGMSIYGPEALEIYGLIRDGFQIPQNRFALANANMGFVEITPGRKIPDFVHERFINRVQSSVFLRREIQRVYAVPTILSAGGVIETVTSAGEYSLDWDTQNVET
jgi:hypothetical protein